MSKNRYPNGWWDTYEHCAEEAKKYKSRSEFGRHCVKGYQVAREKGWIEEFFPTTLIHTEWTYEEIKDIVNKCKNIRELQEKYNGAYNSAKRNGWLYDMFEKRDIKQSGWWDTYEHCEEEAKKYKTKSEFHSGNSRAYQVSRKNKWLSKFTWLKYEKSKSITKSDNIYSYEFPDLNYVYVGRTVSIEDTKNRHKTSRKDSVYKFCLKNNFKIPDMKILEENLTIEEGSEKEGVWLKKYIDEGWIPINKVPTGSIGNLGDHKWTKDKCKEESKKYISRTDFCKKNKIAYEKSRKNGWIAEFFPKKNLKI